jgi:hypothetical protein
MRCGYVLIAMLAMPLAAHGDLLSDGGVSAAEIAARTPIAAAGSHARSPWAGPGLPPRGANVRIARPA